MIAGRGSGPLLLIATLLLWLTTATWAGDLPRRGTLGLELDPRGRGDSEGEAGMESEVADAHTALQQILVMRGGLDVQNPPGESDILLRVLDEGKHPSHQAVVLPGLDGDMGAASSELEALRRLAAGDRGAEGADRVARLLRAWLDSPENIPDALLKASPTENEKGEVP